MDSNVTDTTQHESIGADANAAGVNDRASLNEDDLASYLTGQTETITKVGKGGRSVPLFGETSVSNDSSEKTSEDRTEAEEELDLSLLEGDSDKDTNESDASANDDEAEYEIQVDGQKVKVKQSDLIADAQKWRASNDKFQEASKMRKEADELMNAYQQERETLKGLLNHYQSFIEQSYKNQEPNWQELFDSNPAEYIRQKEIWSGRMQQVQQAKAMQEQIKAQENAELEARQAEFLTAQKTKLFEMFPTWKDETVRTKAAKDIDAYLNAEGFTEDERNGLSDARLLVVAHKAAMYDKLVKANAEKKTKQAPSKQTLKAGAATNNDPGFRQRQAQTQAARDAKAVNDQFRSNPSARTLEAYLANQWKK